MAADARREIPFVDKAYKNGNYLLYDASVELRVSSLLMNSPWDSFIRASWAFNEITGIGDVNGDDIQEAFETGFGNAISGESEKPGPRIFVGFGTGW